MAIDGDDGGRAERDRVSEGWPPFAFAGRAPARLHVAAVTLFVAVLVWRFWPSLTSPIALNDEISYVRAARFVAEGRSPYTRGGYLYPPPVAWALALAIERWGLPPTLVALRLANDLGLAIATWVAVGWLPWRARGRLLVGAAYLALAPAVRFGVVFSNLSLAVAGLILPALLLWPRRPIAAGAMLGVSLAIKPVAPAALAVLAAHRPAAGGRRHLVAALTAAAAAALLVLPVPHLAGFFDLPTVRAGQLARSVSPHRLAYLLGWRENIVLLTALLLAVAVWAARRRPLGPAACLALAVAAAVTATPVVWSHTLLLTLPLQAAALRRTVARRRAAAGAEVRRWRDYELALVALAVAALQLAEGASGVYDRALTLQLAASVLPALAPAALAAYVIAGLGAARTEPVRAPSLR